LLVPITVFAEENQHNDRFRFYQIFASEKQWYTTECDMAKNSNLRSKTAQTLREFGYSEFDSKLECAQVTGKVNYDKDEGDKTSTFGLTLDESITKAKEWDYDLLIVVFDTKFSKQYYEQTTHLKENKPYYWGGHFQFDTKTIVTGTHLEDSEDDKATQTLVHEIAHFHVDKIYNSVISIDAVHLVDDEFDECLARGLPSDCSHTWIYLKTHNSPVPVMSPDYVIKVAESMKPKPITPMKDSDGDGYADNQDSCPTQRENFNGYQDHDGCPDNPTSNQNKSTSNQMHQLMYDYETMKIKLQTDIANKINKYRNLSFDSPLGNAKYGYVMNELRKINFDSNDHDMKVHTQRWTDGLQKIGENGVREEIKELYGIANDLRQLDREITKAKSLESEFKSKQIQEKNEIFKSNEKIASQNLNPSLYVIGNDGKKSKQLTIKLNEKFTIEGYIYKNNMPQKYTTYKILDNVGNTKDGKTNNDGFFRHVLTSEHSVHQNFGQGSDESSTTIIKVCVSSNCESVKVFVRGDNNESQSNLNNSNENQSENMLQNNGEPSKHAKIKLQHEVQDLQALSHDKINSVKKEIEEAKRTLEHIPQDSPEKIKKINQAWDLLKDTQTKLDEVESRVKTGNVQLSYGNYENAKSFFNNNDQMNEKIDENLKKVTQLVDETSKPQTCFLFWCW